MEYQTAPMVRLHVLVIFFLLVKFQKYQKSITISIMSYLDFKLLYKK